MKLGTRTAAYGLAGLAVAGAVILSGTTLGLLSWQPSGLLSVLLTDPPSVPEGVSAVYVTYTGVAVHAVGFGDSGWVPVPGRGTIDTMSLVNLSQTISSGTIPALTYNQARFTISNASVDFMGRNYTASMGSGDIEVTIVGGLKVNTSSPAATLIDVQPTVVNLGDSSRPSFTLAAGARALQVPRSDVDPSTHEVGHRTSLGGHGWYTAFESKSASNTTLTGLALSADSLSFTSVNGGPDAVAVRFVMIAPSQNGGGEGAALGSVVNGAAFAVQPNGSLVLLGASPGQPMAYMGGSGYILAPGSTRQFSYSGTIASIFGDRGITAGTTYYVIIMGPGTLSVETVVAS